MRDKDVLIEMLRRARIVYEGPAACDGGNSVKVGDIYFYFHADDSLSEMEIFNHEYDYEPEEEDG